MNPVNDKYFVAISVADPGFPRGGGANSPGGAPTYDFAKFSQKLHEIERIWAPGGACVPRAPLNAPLHLPRYHWRMASTVSQIVVVLVKGFLSDGSDN